MNFCVVSGRICKEIELSQSKEGGCYLKNCIAINNFQKKGSTATFVDFTVFSEEAERFAKWMKKGEKVTLTGKLNSSLVKCQDGVSRGKININVTSFEPNESKPQPKAQPKQQSNNDFDYGGYDGTVLGDEYFD